MRAGPIRGVTGRSNSARRNRPPPVRPAAVTRAGSAASAAGPKERCPCGRAGWRSRLLRARPAVRAGMPHNVQSWPVVLRSLTPPTVAPGGALHGTPSRHRDPPRWQRSGGGCPRSHPRRRGPRQSPGAVDPRDDPERGSSRWGHGMSGRRGSALATACDECACPRREAASRRTVSSQVALEREDAVVRRRQLRHGQCARCRGVCAGSA